MEPTTKKWKTEKKLKSIVIVVEGWHSIVVANRRLWLHCGMTKYRKGPQRTTKDPQRTAKEHYGLSCRKLTPIELNGALYCSARQDFSHAAGLIENLTGRRCQSRSGSASGTLCSRWHAKAMLLARSNQHLLMAAWPSCTVQNPDAGKKLGSRRRPSADRTKQEAKTD